MQFLFFLFGIFICFAEKSLAISNENIACTSELKGIENIFEEANKKKCPVLLVFLAKEKCPWSQKFLHEVIHHANFIEAMQKECLIQTVQVPINMWQNDEKDMERNLVEHFEIKEFPKLVLLTSDGEVIHQEGFLPLDGDHYIKRYKDCISLYHEFKDFIACPSRKSPDEGLESLYSKASDHGMIQLQNLIKSYAKDSSSLFFLLERYEELLKTRKKKDPQVQKVRSQIIASDPDNKNKGMLRLAMVDFLSVEEHKKNRKSPKDVIEPLEEYVRKFGDNDSENRWKIEMVIAQFMFSKGELVSAVKHATRCLQVAPFQVKGEIAQMLDYMKHRQANR